MTFSQSRLAQFLSILPSRAASVLLLSALLALAGCSSPAEQADKYYRNGMAMLEEGDPVRARLQFQNALQIAGNMAQATYGLALVAEQQADWERMFRLLNRVVEQDPRHPQAHLKLGQLLLAAGQLDGALASSDTALALSPSEPSVLALRAAILYRLNDTQAAVAEARAALALEPGNVEALVVLATASLAEGRGERAIAYLDQGLARDDRNVGLQLLKVRTLEEFGRIEAARGVFQQLIDANPDAHGMRRALAHFHQRHGSPAEAERQLRKIVELQPDDLDSKVEVVRFVGALRGPAAAVETLKAFIQERPQDHDLHFALADLHRHQGNTEAGHAVLRGIAERAGTSAHGLRAQGQLAAVLMAAGERAAAEPLVAGILAAESADEQGLYLRAGMAVDDRRLDNAIADLRALLRDHPESARALLLLGRAHDLAGSPELAEGQYLRAFQASGQQPHYGIAYAEFLLRRGGTSRAAQVLEEVLRGEPGNDRALRLLAQVRISQGDWIAAQELADEISRRGDEARVAEQIKGVVFAARKNYDASISAFRNAHQASPHEAQPMVALVRTYVAAGRHAEAVNFVNSVLRASPANVTALLLRGQLHLLQGEQTEAAERFAAAISAAPDNILGYRNLAGMHLRAGRHDEADRVLALGLKAIPQDFGLRLSQAAVYEQAGRIEDAIELYEQLLAERPDADVLANNLSSLLSMYRSDRASFERAYALARRFERSDVPQFKDTLGWAHYRLGRYHAAVDLLESATRQLPDLPVMRYHLGMSYLALENGKRARAELETALQLAERYPFAQAEQARAALLQLD